MIGFLRGRVAGYSENTMTLDVSGVGFEINVGARTASLANNSPDEVTIYTYMAVREDDISLYGFLSKDEINLFRLLLTVSGIGPKGALQIVSSMGADDLRFAILTGDAKGISQNPGIGLKTAQKLILELKDKLGRMSPEDKGGSSSGSSGGFEGNDIRNEAVQALTALGYSSSESYKAVKAACENGQAKDAGELLKKALKYLG